MYNLFFLLLLHSSVLLNAPLLFPDRVHVFFLHVTSNVKGGGVAAPNLLSRDPPLYLSLFLPSLSLSFCNTCTNV